MAKKKTAAADVKKVDLRKLKKEERPAPSTGQSGPEMNLVPEKLNKDERLVLKELNDGEKNPMKIVDIADAIRKAKRNEFTPLRCRNALRRLVRGLLVTAKARGEYKITSKGSKASEAAEGLPLPAKGTRAARAPKAAKPEKEPKAAKATTTKAAKKQAKAAKVTTKSKKAKPPVEDDDDTKPQVESTTSFSDEVETELAQFGGKFKRTDPHYKGAIVIAAIRSAGLSDSKIAKATGLSRGFCITRVKRLKAAGILSAPDTDDEFARAVVVAEADGGHSNGSSKGKKNGKGKNGHHADPDGIGTSPSTPDLEDDDDVADPEDDEDDASVAGSY